jgi:transcriptional adapter 3
VPDSLKNKIELRRRWMDTVGRTMRERPTGEVIGLPTKSIFEGIDESDSEKIAEDDVDDAESTVV